MTDALRVAVVTGAGRGIGAAISRAFSRAGVAVVLADIDATALCATASDLRGEGADVEMAIVDVRDEASLDQLSNTALERYGRIDIVVANAAIADRGAFLEGDPVSWKSVLETNLLGAAMTVRAFAQDMVRRGSGDIVLMASLSGRTAYVGEPLYIASKWGLIGLGHSLRAEFAPFDVRVIMVEPGIVRTDLSARDATGRSMLAKTSPLDADDVAAAVMYAISQPPNVVISELVVQPRHLSGW